MTSALQFTTPVQLVFITDESDPIQTVLCRTQMLFLHVPFVMELPLPDFATTVSLPPQHVHLTIGLFSRLLGQLLQPLMLLHQVYTLLAFNTQASHLFLNSSVIQSASSWVALTFNLFE